MQLYSTPFFRCNTKVFISQQILETKTRTIVSLFPFIDDRAQFMWQGPNLTAGEIVVAMATRTWSF